MAPAIAKRIEQPVPKLGSEAARPGIWYWAWLWGAPVPYL